MTIDELVEQLSRLIESEVLGADASVSKGDRIKAWAEKARVVIGDAVVPPWEGNSVYD